MIKGWTRAAALGWALVLVSVCLLAWQQRQAVDTSILSLLPHFDAKPAREKALQRLDEDYSSRLLLLVQHEQADRARDAVDRIVRRLQNQPRIASVDWQIDARRLGQVNSFYTPWRYQVLAQSVRERLDRGEEAELVQAGLRRLLSPMGAGGIDPVADPFALLPQYLAGLSNDTVVADRGLMRLSSKEIPTYLISARLDGDPFELGLQQSLVPELQQMRSELSAQGGRLLISGVVLHAAEGAKQARSEISTIGLVSVIGVVLLVLLAFRRISAPVVVLVPVAAGCLFAAAITSLIFGRLHLVTLAFGAGLVGVSVDYALHYMAAREAAGRASVLPRIIAGLALGGVSSLLAYGAQALAPFPGLRQMACFAVAGLTGAWLAVVLWFPVLLKPAQGSDLAAAARLVDLVNRIPRLTAGSAAFCTAFLLLVGAVLLVTGTARDDLRLLQTSSEQLLDEDQEVREILSLNSSYRFFIVTAENAESLLQREERIKASLSPLADAQPGFKYSALSDWVPSQQRQQANLDRVRGLYSHQLPSFFDRIGLSQLQAPAEQALASAAGDYLKLDDWLQSLLADAASGLWLGGVDQGVASMIRLSGSDRLDGEALAYIANGVEGVFYVDRVADISGLLGSYREQISYWVAAAYLLVLGALALRYRRAGWRVIAPPLLAGLLVAGILSHLGGGLNLFNLLGLLLVLGVGLDMGIFLAEGKGDSHTWLAVTLSMLTSLLAFGLLAFSATPLLHHFGLTVLLGLVFVWFLTAIMRQENPLKELG
ncbi:MMPL family transporter [Marinobacterium lutimaris]|uniref:Predicted exporter n=1 Tax=Marinobacterium lutimaris TaxID=568106 RepID=A0A1H5TBT3_9GAMM|nr:hypothetical protein [Marinobacterium lutimaris]SEF60302.1 Predicted exporter [Marinobacterium lutimaris]